jgi:hypothetical protein
MTADTLPPGTHTYTVWVLWVPGYGEEIDVLATSEAQARAKAIEILEADYGRGYRITRIQERPDGFMF